MVKAEISTQIIPTYELGKSEINPVFFEKRVYQGSSGKVYPVPFIDKVYDHSIDRKYQTATLENEFVKLVTLPEIGGRIFEAQDKSNNNYDFFYKQEVIKPALVGLAGPWISGGVEFNWPQHHRPGTYLPSDVFIEEESDGAKTIWMSEYDPMYRLKGMHGIRLRPDSALIELRVRLFNRTAITQSFLWWANVAVKAHDNYQSFFPPDVHYVADHAVRAISSFPFAENDYYGIPYHLRPGKNDLRKYNNITVPTSYMVCDTLYDFFGGYDDTAEGGFVHVANRHIAPGKKQWTWGNEEFGKAWDRELTDIGGPYLELMAGVFTDNQPDFSYLLPFETKTFSQFWWSYKKLGPVQNANKELAIKLIPKEGNLLEIGVASSRRLNNLTILFEVGDKEERIEGISISPNVPWLSTRRFEMGEEHRITLSVVDQNGKKLLSYAHAEIDKSHKHKVAIEPNQPEEVKSSIRLDMIGEHLELYRHPTRHPEPYWEEAIRQDPANFKAYVSLAKAAIKSGLFNKAKEYALTAIDILTTFHPNPSNGEAYYYHAISCYYLGELDLSYKSFYKATWNYEWRSASYYMLATIDARRKHFDTAIEHIDASLTTNTQNNSATVLKVLVLSELDRKSEAEQVLENLLNIDPLDQWANFELGYLRNDFQYFLKSCRNDAQTVIDIAFEYARSGFYQRAKELIKIHLKAPEVVCAVPNPMGRSNMTNMILSWLYYKDGATSTGDLIFKNLCDRSLDYFFPSRLEELEMLEWMAENKPNNTMVLYGLGNFYFNVKRHQDAIKIWEKAVEAGCDYATLHRNLGIAHWNANQDEEKARYYFENAVRLSPDDMRIQYEYDQLRKKLNDDPKERLLNVLCIGESVLNRDDFSVELVALYNYFEQSQKALDLLISRTFHPWEGGEGQVLQQFSHACLSLGQKALNKKNPQKALEYFERSMNTPDNLGEKYHPLQAVAHINYWKGIAYRALNKRNDSIRYFELSAQEKGDFIDMSVSDFSELTYYKALSMKELGKEKEALSLLNSLKLFAENKMGEKANIDYFATSLPLLLVFDDDIQKRNDIEALYLLGLAELGLENEEKATNHLNKVLELNVTHIGAKGHLALLNGQVI